MIARLQISPQLSLNQAHRNYVNLDVGAGIQVGLEGQMRQFESDDLVRSAEETTDLYIAIGVGGTF